MRNLRPRPADRSALFYAQRTNRKQILELSRQRWQDSGKLTKTDRYRDLAAKGELPGRGTTTRITTARINRLQYYYRTPLRTDSRLKNYGVKK